MDSSPLIERIKMVTNLSNDLETALRFALKPEFYKARQVIISPGQKEDRIWFLTEGHARSYYYDKDGQEHTVRFWLPGEFIFTFTGFYLPLADCYIDILEDTTVLALSYDQLSIFKDEFVETGELIKHFLVLEREKEKERRNLATLPPAKRYLEFRSSHASVFRVAPLKIIASHLNIARESLSRIMAKR